MSTPSDHVLIIRAPDANMLGVLTQPDDTTPALGVIVVNGGAQYRVGAHRLFVKLARHLACKGHAVLRFDLPGQGDSIGQAIDFQHAAPYVGAAIDALLHAKPDLQQIVLLGLCDGASASLLYLHETSDPRVSGLVLLNPWVHAEASSARTRVKHYYRQRLLMPEFWQKLLAGEVGLAAILDLLRTVTRSRWRLPAETRNFPDRMAQAWKAFPGSILLLISDKDLTGQEFIQNAIEATPWAGALQHAGLAHYMLQQADHTFSPAAAARDLNALVQLWLEKAMKNTRQ